MSVIEKPNSLTTNIITNFITLQPISSKVQAYVRFTLITNRLFIWIIDNEDDDDDDDVKTNKMGY